MSISTKIVLLLIRYTIGNSGDIEHPCSVKIKR